MRLNRREVETLDALAGKEASLSELAAALKLKKPNLSKYISKLEKLELITTRKEGKIKKAALDNGLYSDITALRGALPAIKLTHVLVGKTPFLLASLKDKRTFQSSELDLPIATAKRLLKLLRNLGLISMPKKGTYHLRKEAERIPDFCRKVVGSAYLAEASKELGRIERALYSFESAAGVRAILIVSEQAKTGKWWPTAYSAAHNYGLHLIQAGKWYYTDKKPDLGDVVIHLLACSNDQRGVIYATALVLKNKYDPRLLLKKRCTFGLGKDYILGFVEYIESKGKRQFQGLESLDEAKGSI